MLILKTKILFEIDNGLTKDVEDVELNIMGHRMGLKACTYFSKIFRDQEVDTDSIMFYYIHLTGDYVCMQNVAGYETLKSKGLELIQDDSLRLQIISLYEYDYTLLRKLEEEYYSMQFHENYFKEINSVLAPIFQLDEAKNLVGPLKLPIEMEENQRKKMLLYIFNIRRNRNFVLQYYADIETKINRVKELIHIESEK